MKKKNKKALSVVLITLAVVGGLSAITIVSNNETGWLDGLVRNEEKTDGLFTHKLGSVITAVTETDEAFKQEIEFNDESNPFENLLVEYKSYAEEDEEASVRVNGEVVTCDFIEEVKLTYTLEKDVDFNIGTISLNGFGFADLDDEEELFIEVRVDGVRFTEVDYSENRLYLADINPECGEVEIIIKNPYAKEKKVEAHSFTLGTIVFNTLDTTTYPVEE